MRFTIRRVDIRDELVRQAICAMLSEVFEPGAWEGKPRDGDWWIALARGREAGFAGLSPSTAEPGAGYFCAAGVLKAYRGRGLYKRLIRRALEHARNLGLGAVITDTINDNAASANALIGCGFRQFIPSTKWATPYAVYWRKAL